MVCVCALLELHQRTVLSDAAAAFRRAQAASEDDSVGVHQQPIVGVKDHGKRVQV